MMKGVIYKNVVLVMPCALKIYIYITTEKKIEEKESIEG